MTSPNTAELYCPESKILFRASPIADRSFKVVCPCCDITHHLSSFDESYWDNIPDGGEEFFRKFVLRIFPRHPF